MNQYDFNPYECQCDYFDDSYGTSTTATTSTKIYFYLYISLLLNI